MKNKLQNNLSPTLEDFRRDYACRPELQKIENLILKSILKKRDKMKNEDGR